MFSTQFWLGAALFGTLALAISGIAQESTPLIPNFMNETQSSGVSSRYTGDWEYMVGGGVAVFDCNSDGFPDAFLAGGTSKAQLYRNTSSRGGSLLFKREPGALEVTNVTGAYPLDVDSDGITDLVTLRVGENIVYRGLGGCRFARANEVWGFQGGDDWSVGFSATWERGNTFPTLAVGNYIDRAQTDDPWGHCTPNVLHRPVSPSSKRFASAVPLKPSYCTLSMLFSDWNRSGTPSLRVSNDREYYKGGQEQLWKPLEAGKTPALFTAGEGWRKLQIWGMGIATEDLDGDGFPEYFLSSMADQKLQTLASGAATPTYTDAALKRGVTAHRPYLGDTTHPSTGWHSQFADVNNDGRSDLFIAKGNVDAMPDFAMQDPNNLLLQTSDGSFMEAGDKGGVASTKQGRGAAVVDFNLDGKLDLIVVNRRDNAELWRNTGTTPPQNWLEFRVTQPAPNRDAIGAWVEVQLEGGRVIRHEITVGGGHANGSLGWVHFGVGSSSALNIRVQYPGAAWSEWQPVSANNFYALERGLGPKIWIPTR
jgi:enediyne biosynthesis protein E4